MTHKQQTNNSRPEIVARETALTDLPSFHSKGRFRLLDMDISTALGPRRPLLPGGVFPGPADGTARVRLGEPLPGWLPHDGEV